MPLRTWRECLRLRRAARLGTEAGQKSARSEAGMATAELALSFPAVILVLVALGLTGAAGMGQVQVNAAARAACRAVAIGQSPGEASAKSQELIGGQGSIQISVNATDIQCRAQRKLTGLMSLAGFTVSSQAVIPREDSW